MGTAGKNKVASGVGRSGGHDRDPRGELVGVVADQPITMREDSAVRWLEGAHLVCIGRRNGTPKYSIVNSQTFFCCFENWVESS